MSEEKIEYKINIPMFEVGELERFDNHIHEIIEEYSKMMFKEKDQILTQRIIMKQEEEIERLNNIINELEKWLNEKICLNKNDKDYINGMAFVGVNLQMYQMFLDKLQELKGDKSNE